jgi:hypothetical protein
MASFPRFPPTLLSLSDAQLQIVMAAAHPLMPAVRDEFFAAVAARLSGVTEIGEGAVSRACREIQRAYFDPPSLGGRTMVRPYERRST